MTGLRMVIKRPCDRHGPTFLRTDINVYILRSCILRASKKQMEKQLHDVCVRCLAAGAVQLWSTSGLRGKKRCALPEKAAADTTKHVSCPKTSRENKDGLFLVEGSCAAGCFSGVEKNSGRD